jgi:hypothetical protein
VELVTVALSTVAVVVSVVFAIFQLRSAQRANHMLVAIELLTRDRISDTFIESEDYVLNRLVSECPRPVAVSALPIEARKHVMRLCLFYNSLGQMMLFNVVDQNLLISTVSFRARSAWRAMEPYILAERAARGEAYMPSFEHLVYVVTQNPVDRARRRLGWRRFAGYPAALNLPVPAAVPSPGAGTPAPAVSESRSARS